MNQETSTSDSFLIEHRGGLTLIQPSARLEELDLALARDAAIFLLEPLRKQEEPSVIVDLASIDFIGSSFLALLLRCWKIVQQKGGQMVLVGVSEQARELLRITHLDTILPIYRDRQEAIEALLTD